MKISDLAPTPGAKKKEKRIGRGPGSGHGKTATKGHKGQAARSGGTKPPGFEGGQQPLIRRVPKRGFKNIFRKEYAVVNLSRLDQFAADTVINPEFLYQAGIIKKTSENVKVLGTGALTKPLVIAAHKFSEEALKKIQAAGGRAEVLS
ncbi:MAG: 50S ribosomal protein L15 [Candidatus Manganitrophaceae bacterium]|nr:MAG: 50S ribosomal protein L15 [Candidatus Manganitrophaceae bacterium]